MTIKRRLTAIRLDKIAAVDQPCQEHAVVAIIKRAPDADPDLPAIPALAKKTFDEALRGQLVSERVCDVFWRAFENQWAVREAFREALTDEIAAGGDGSEAIDGFTAAMQQIASAAAEAARNAASTADTDLETAVEEAVSKWLQQQEQPMNITTKAQLKTAVANFDPAVAKVADVIAIQKAATDLGAEDELPVEGPLAVAKADPNVAKMARELAELKLPADVRKHYDGLDETAKVAFLAKSSADQAADVEAANSADPVVHKCKDGTEIRKSDGAAVLALAKRNDAQADELAKLRGEVSSTSVENTAVTKYPNVAKAVAVDMLKSIDTLGADTEAGKAVQKSLTEMNKARGQLYTSIGTEEAPEIGGDIAKARQDFNTEVAKVQSTDKLGLADAMSKVRADRPDLYEAAFPESAAADAE